MSGTTDALAGIAAKLSGGDMDGALDDAARLENEYSAVADALYRRAGSAGKAKKHIQNSFSLVREICRSLFRRRRKNHSGPGGTDRNPADVRLYLAETGYMPPCCRQSISYGRTNAGSRTCDLSGNMRAKP